MAQKADAVRVLLCLADGAQLNTDRAGRCSTCKTQRLQNPSIKEYTLNYNRNPNMEPLGRKPAEQGIGTNPSGFAAYAFSLAEDSRRLEADGFR